VELFELTLKTVDFGDNNLLIQRLRHNVLNAALKRIVQAYARIGLADVSHILRLEQDDAELVISKAIREGVV